MCQRHHQPEPFTIGGMKVVICDDFSMSDYSKVPAIIIGGNPAGARGTQLTQGVGGDSLHPVKPPRHGALSFARTSFGLGG